MSLYYALLTSIYLRSLLFLHFTSHFPFIILLVSYPKRYWPIFPLHKRRVWGKYFQFIYSYRPLKTTAYRRWSRCDRWYHHPSRIPAALSAISPSGTPPGRGSQPADCNKWYEYSFYIFGSMQSVFRICSDLYFCYGSESFLVFSTSMLSSWF